MQMCFSGEISISTLILAIQVVFSKVGNIVAVMAPRNSL